MSRPITPTHSMHNASPTPGVEEAINRLLQAERDAYQAMLACDRQAEELLRAAHEHARRIRQRAEKRIQQWYLNSDQSVAERLRELDEQAQALRADATEPPGLTPEWQLAVQRLTDELIGGAR